MYYIQLMFFLQVGHCFVILTTENGVISEKLSEITPFVTVPLKYCQIFTCQKCCVTPVC